MLLLLFAGADAPEPPEEDAPFYAVGGKGIARPAAKLAAGRGAAMQGGDLIAMEAMQAAARDAGDLRDLQEMVAALFTFKGIF